MANGGNGSSSSSSSSSSSNAVRADSAFIIGGPEKIKVKEVYVKSNSQAPGAEPAVLRAGPYENVDNWEQRERVKISNAAFTLAQRNAYVAEARVNLQLKAARDKNKKLAD